MIAYDKHSIDALSIRKQSEKWLSLGLIDEAAKNTIFEKYSSKFKVTTLFAKIGQFIFTLLIAIFASILVAGVIGLGSGEIGASIIMIIFGGTGTFFLEQMIKNKNLYKSGIDNALVFFSSFSIIGGLAVIINNSHDNLGITYFIAFIIFTVYAVRYSDVLSTIGAYICLLTSFYIMLSSLAFAVIPFAVMIFSVSIYWQTKRKLKENDLRFWHRCLHVVEILSLLTFYLSGNYFVIRSMTTEIMNIYLEDVQEIPMAIFFYFYTAIIPIAYIIWALKIKDRILLITGLLITVLSSLTFKKYFSLGHTEILLTVVGIIIMLIGYAGFKYLKIPKHGFTIDPDKEHEELEALIIAQTFKPTTSHSSESNTEFGGGSFGGGGAGNKF